MDAPPTGADGGKFVKFAPLMAGKAPVKFADGIFVNPYPDPLNDVAVKIPVTTAPVFVACTFVAAPNFNAEASMPDNCEPSPLNDVAVITPALPR